MINSQPGSHDYNYHKNCELEVDDWIKHFGGASEVAAWYYTIPANVRRMSFKAFWGNCIDDAPYVSFNDHTYEYFQEQVGARAPYVPAKAEDFQEPVWDDTDIFRF